MSDDLPPDLEDFSDRFATKLEETKKTTPEKEENTKPPNHGGLLEVPGTEDVPLAAAGVPFKHKLDETNKGSTMPVSMGEGADIRPSSEDKKQVEAAKTEKSKEEPQFLTGWGTPEQEAIQKMMIDAALANTPDAQQEIRMLERQSIQGFLKKTSLKGGFLNRSKKPAKKTTSAATKTKTSTTKDKDIIEVKIDPAKAAAERNAMLSRDVQEQLRSQLPAMEKKLMDGSWMTQDFMELVAKDSRLTAGMANPRWMEALQRMRTEPEAVMNEYKDDKGFQDWIMAFMGIMGDQFTRLGAKEEEEEKKKAKKAPPSAGSDLVPAASRKVEGTKAKKAGPPRITPISEKTEAPKASSSAAGASHDDDAPPADDDDLDDEHFDSISVTGVEDQTVADEEGWGSDSSDVSVTRAYGPYIVPQPFARPGNMFEPKKGLLAPEGPSSDVIAKAAKTGALGGIDEDVREILSNPELVEALRDPEVHRMLEECRLDGRAMRKYASDPKWARKLMLLQNAGDRKSVV